MSANRKENAKTKPNTKPKANQQAGFFSHPSTAPHGEEKKTELDYSRFQTFVIAPTKAVTDYEKADKSDLEKKFADEILMCKRDMQFLNFSKAPAVCPAIIFTGYHGDIADAIPFAKFISSIATIPPEVPISLCFTSHGTPGNMGKFGFGSLGEGDFDYRMNIDYLIQLLIDNGFEQLKDRPIKFQFRCCNSGYSCIDRYEKSPDVKARSVLEQSLIGYFWRQMQTIYPDNNFNVEGFRGFFYPEEKAVHLRKVKGGSSRPKDEVTSADGTITIDNEGQVVIPPKAISVVQNGNLDAFVTENRFPAPPKPLGLTR